MELDFGGTAYLKILREFEKDNPQVVKNIFNSVKNVKAEYLLNT